MKNIKAMNISSMIVVILTVVLTVLSEVSKPFKGFLAGITGHHWVTKSVVAVLFFVFIYFGLSKNVKDTKDFWKEAKTLTMVVVLGILVIFVFYVLHFFGYV